VNRLRGGLACLVCALALGACATPIARSPATLEDAAAALPDGPGRASIHLTAQAAHALEAGQVEQARGLVARALRIDGRNAHAYYLLGWIGIARGDLRAARRDLDQAEALFGARVPPEPEWQGKVLRVRAELLGLEGDVASAAQLRDRADELDPLADMPGTPPVELLDKRR
jgi:tetratricopeptide (TPR) repeat protein